MDISHVLEKLSQFKKFCQENNSESFEYKFYDFETIEVHTGDKLYKIKNNECVGVTDKPCSIVGTIIFKFPDVSDYFKNPMGKVHGGAMATWVDCVTSMGILALDKKERLTHVSVNLAVDYVSGASIGDDLYFKVDVTKVGRSLAFTRCDILLEDGTLVASGTHTKAFIDMAKL